MSTLAETTLADPVDRIDRYPSRVNEAAAMLDRADPVVWGDPDGGPLTADQLADFDRDGFLVLDDLFTAEELAGYRAELHRMTTDPATVAGPETITEPGSEDLVRSIFAVHRSSPLVRALAADPRLADVTRQLLGSDVYLHQSRVNFKRGLFGKEFYWHSDFETWHTEDGMPAMRAVSASISLTENTEHNGPLLVMPGSHRRYVSCAGATPAENYKTSLKSQEVGTPAPHLLEELFAEGGIVSTTGPAGLVTIFDANLMHGSNSNITPLARSNVFCVYNSVENRLQKPFAAPGIRPEYIAHRDYVDTLPRR